MAEPLRSIPHPSHHRAHHHSHHRSYRAHHTEHTANVALGCHASWSRRRARGIGRRGCCSTALAALEAPPPDGSRTRTPSSSTVATVHCNHQVFITARVNPPSQTNQLQWQSSSDIKLSSPKCYGVIPLACHCSPHPTLPSVPLSLRPSVPLFRYVCAHFTQPTWSLNEPSLQHVHL